MDGLMWFHKDKKGTITRYGYGFTLRPGCFLMPELAMEMDYFPASQGLWFRVNGLMVVIETDFQGILNEKGLLRVLSPTTIILRVY